MMIKYLILVQFNLLKVWSLMLSIHPNSKNIFFISNILDLRFN
jgi:hypothetical protein